MGLPSAPLRVAVIIASTGRPDCIATIVRHLRAQTLAPSRIILSVAADRDLPAPSAREGCEVVIAPRGLPAQRNAGLAVLAGDSDVVAFFDDDFVPSRFAVETLSSLFAQHPDIAGATGHVLADGIKTPGIPAGRAERLVEEHDCHGPPSMTYLRDVHGLYGCNMAYRTALLGGLRFDERLKLYGWQEDVDFASQVSRRGRTVETDAFAGVHLGTKSGRTSGVRLGYSQIQNPLYLLRKGTMRPGKAWKLMSRNLVMNHVRSLWPEPWVDRFGRVRGNWLGFADLLRGRLTPERIEEL
ncbi:glycosyl transferase group 1 [Novosphingobium nitrogenifigens DSM 19370]|uniref:Glycosyl transferase group 1 n=1 Tax=Novosphingobium nitrogenifigens DSM 19370 TaxID=983920 RepID=F1Z6E6_9SPHN|nr:glycosyltransferase family 2 protein [Novosphingobium nitrogenifigens]EGD59927.1 glycosyl transferase group 1 [Novosphingobium nitrogenifigens DSM 19370]